MRVAWSIALLATWAYASCAHANEDIWLLVETRPHTLKVMAGNETKEIFTRIAIGRRGVGFRKQRGDDKTPLGRYRIGWINENSRYYRFFGFTFPNPDNARRALRAGLIGEETYQTIVRAEMDYVTPPQDTPLGGQIGIHGLGEADQSTHELFDWTHGCIAMTNEQIDRLTPWVKKGILVVIR
jgi:murein L,D-transpeptidase YafK